ncbi:MAG: hypothetical protein SGI88_21315, partial [Candidatus Hydrogenedentes bacterium]|nr:hypothetical protein [Candidatus Hydrogenedentota bacterium]
MSANSPQGPNDRIRELEARVDSLTRELESVHAQRRSTGARGRRISDPLPKPPPPTGRLWTVRAIMFLLVTAIGAAAAFTYSGYEFSISTIARDGAAVRIDWVLFACSVVALIAVIAHRRRPLGFILFALFSGYIIFALYLAYPAATVSIGQRWYAWLAYCFLTVWHMLIAALCVMESRRIGRGRTRSATLATLNSAAYYPLVWYGLHAYGSTNEALIYTALALIAVLLAVYAESSGAHRNYLFHVFLASALLLLNVVLYQALDGAWLIAALSLECLGLAALYHATGIIALKAVNLIVLLATFVVTMQAMKFTGPMYIGSQTIHSNWAQGLFTSAIMLATSWYYARHIRSVKPSHRKLSGHWFLADTAFDVPSSTVSLLHAAGASLLLTLLAISDLGDLPSLPFILGVFSAGIAALGFVLRAPQIETGAVM